MGVESSRSLGKSEFKIELIGKMKKTKEQAYGRGKEDVELVWQCAD